MKELYGFSTFLSLTEPTEFYEVPYGKAQFVMIYNSDKVKEAPTSLEKLKVNDLNFSKYKGTMMNSISSDYNVNSLSKFKLLNGEYKKSDRNIKEVAFVEISLTAETEKKLREFGDNITFSRKYVENFRYL